MSADRTDPIPSVFYKTSDGSGWRTRLVGGGAILIVADGVGLDQDPLVFSSLMERGGQREEMPVVVMRAPDVKDVDWMPSVPLAIPDQAVRSQIESNPIPLWELQLSGGVLLHVRADSMRRDRGWYVFSFRIRRGESVADEPVALVPARRLAEVRLAV